DYLFKGTEVERPSSARPRARRRRVGWPRTADAAVFHHDDERLAFALREQVVHNETRVALATPARFIFAAAIAVDRAPGNVCSCPCRNRAACKRRCGASCRWTSRSNTPRAAARAAHS